MTDNLMDYDKEFDTVTRAEVRSRLLTSVHPYRHAHVAHPISGTIDHIGVLWVRIS